jgi:tetratricopeptide (TPR) repeat protein
MDRTKALVDLFLSLFSDVELRMFLRSLPAGEALAPHLPAGAASLSLLAFEAVSLLERHGRIDAALFRRLHQERPGRRADIDGVARLALGGPAPAPRIFISRLPLSGAHFVGRTGALARLDQAWEEPDIRVLSIVGLGGTGKTALVNRWLLDLQQDGWRGAERVFGWSFYSQGTRDSVTSAEPFIDAALRWFGDAEPGAGSPRDRGLRLADLIRRQPTLLVLDGVEPLQHPPGRGRLEGRLKDMDLAVVLRELAAHMHGLCVITTRLPVADLAGTAGLAQQIELGGLSPSSGVSLLRQLGVIGSDAELHEATEDMHGHALALTLLGRYLERARGGDVRCRADLPVLEAAGRIGSDKAFRVMAAYDAWLGERERAVLRLLGLFDRPADEGAIAALRAPPPIPGLTDGLNDGTSDLPEDLWRITLSNLRSMALLAPAVAHAPGALDAHPLVRAYFGELLREQQPEAWRAANLRLYEHYRAVAPPFADSLEELTPLIAAMIHGCHAGSRQEALNEIYWRRIRCGGMQHSVHVLGAFGADLTALSGLFDRLWDQPAAELEPGDQAFVLNEAGYDLRALGRLVEARAPMQASLERQKQRQEWKSAAVAASNLAELLLALGHVELAIEQAEESVALADRSDDAFAVMACRTTLADVLHHSGRPRESAVIFEEAEVVRAQHHEQPRLVSLDWYSYCDLLLGRVVALESIFIAPPVSSDECRRFRTACEEVLARAASLLQPRSPIPWLVALGHLALGRAHLGLAVVARLVLDGEHTGVAHVDLAARHLDEAVSYLRRSGREDYVPRGLLARARLGRWMGDGERVLQDLTEALDIAERGSMQLHACDARLEWARYHVSLGDLDAARPHVTSAMVLVAFTGYGRRQAELEALLTAVSPGADPRRFLARREHDDDAVAQTIKMAYASPAWPADAPASEPEPAQIRDLHELEGVWVSDEGMIFCARVVNGKLRALYSESDSGPPAGEVYDCWLRENCVLGVIRWFDAGYTGAVRLRVDSDGQMSGHWWDDADAEVYTVPITLRRLPDKEFPAWAEEYFAGLARAHAS